MNLNKEAIRWFMILLLLIGSLISVYAQELRDVAYIKAKGCEVSSFVIENYVRVTYEKGNVVFDFADGRLSYPLDDYVNVTFSAPCFIDNKKDHSDIGISLHNGILYVKNVRKESDLKIFSLNGVKLYCQRIFCGMNTIPLSQFKERIIIIQIADMSFKVRL